MEQSDQRAPARVIWSAGNFDVLAERIWAVGADLVKRVKVSPGDKVLDVACGSGNAAIPAAVAGGQVTGLDITPELFEAGRRRASEADVEIEWVEGDAEALPFRDGSFDLVLSTMGSMFAPRHDVTASEIARVLRRGGQLALASWTPSGAIGDIFRTIAEHAPDPPPGFWLRQPALWGMPEHVAELFAGNGIRLSYAHTLVRFSFDSVEEAAEEYGTNFGPIVILRQMLEPQGRWQALYDDLEDRFAKLNQSETGGLVFDADYLVVHGHKVG